eukprot:TRINITY_DN10721_c1_g1_i1.p1 TRINITY_DN10721_c1_g1~~TRINITY_DN10721_c1_g1_i1.p1  ORF type:complete len:191 (+),score=56.34 TRINITY_DN10721_c1_g1_i1:64-636(+)
MNEIKNTFENFIDQTESDCRIRLMDDFVMFTKIVDWEMFTKNEDGSGSSNPLNPSPEETKIRVEKIMNSTYSWTDMMEKTDDGYQNIALMASKMFAGIRFFFAKYVKNKMSAFFLDPMLQGVNPTVMNHFYQLSESRYEEIFLDGVGELKQLQAKLETQLAACTVQRNRFKEMYYRMKAPLIGEKRPLEQ